MKRVQSKLVGLALAALSAAGCAMTDSFVKIGTCSVTLATDGVKSLDVNDPIGNVRISPSSSEQISVTADVSVRSSLLEKFPTADAARDLTVVVEDGKLRVANPHAKDGKRIDVLLDLTIEVPASFPWKVVVGTGNVEVTGAGNDVDATAGTGNCRLLGAFGGVRAQSGTGNVVAELERLSGGTFHCGTGNVRLSIDQGDVAQPLRCSSGTGNVALTVPSTLSANVALSSSTGSLVIDGASLERRSSVVGGSAKGVLGGGGTELTATSGTGNVSLNVKR